MRELEDVVEVVEGESSDRSSMKFPRARLLDVRGRCRLREIS